MNKMHICVLVLVIAGCSEKESRMSDFAVAEAPEPLAVKLAPMAPPQQPRSDEKLQIIKTANYKFQVANVDSSTNYIEKTIALHGATIAEINQETSHNEITAIASIRVPAAQFESLLTDLGKYALFTNFKKVSAQDVTEEFIDIQARLKTKKEVYARYVDILKTKAKTVEDVLKAEEQISALQEEIEAKEGRLQYLQSRVAMSTINLEIYQTVEYQPVPDTHQTAYGSLLLEGFVDGWKIVTNSLLLIITFWPFILGFAVLYWKRRWLRGKMQLK